MSDKYGPTPGDRVTTQDLTFTVARRVKHKSTGVIFLIAPSGDRYPLDQCQVLTKPDNLKPDSAQAVKVVSDHFKNQPPIINTGLSQAPKPDPYLNRTFQYAGDTGALQKQFSDIKLTILWHNGAYAQCKGSNEAYYAWVPLDELKRVP